jgi:predicted RNA-binding Zn-ribbon protein involved in translation (DUF1610 family)
MAPNADAVPTVCPDCGGQVITACPRCGTGIVSMMALTCAGCGEELRPAHLFGTEIRRKPERHRRLDSGRAPRDNERTPS